MNYIPPEFECTPRDILPAKPSLARQDQGFSDSVPDRLESRWQALALAASVVASLAGPDMINQKEMGQRELVMPAEFRHVVGSRKRLLEEGLTDLVAIMEPGLTVLLATYRAGVAVKAPAQALWNEFVMARIGLLALAGVGAFAVEDAITPGNAVER